VLWEHSEVYRPDSVRIYVCDKKCKQNFSLKNSWGEGGGERERSYLRDQDVNSRIILKLYTGK